MSKQPTKHGKAWAETASLFNLSVDRLAALAESHKEIRHATDALTKGPKARQLRDLIRRNRAAEARGE